MISCLPIPKGYQKSVFDVISCLPKRVVIHNARMHADMRHMFLNHQDFAFDDVFNDNADNDAVYGGTVHDLILAAAEGDVDTVLMYVQTGSGKAFTMGTIYVRAAVKLFANTGNHMVTVSFIELLGDQLFDMLNGGAPCQCMTSTDGAAFPYPCVEVHVQRRKGVVVDAGSWPTPCYSRPKTLWLALSTQHCVEWVLCRAVCAVMGLRFSPINWHLVASNVAYIVRCLSPRSG